ncbi:MAG: hypothetical protein HYY18_11455 [Planctomycetes bacterium]|nr:hypothetical protein [Planctomycetota bacterium]
MATEEFEILPARELREKYGLTAANRPEVRLDPSRVPSDLHPLIPYAEIWGISDDLIREDAFARTPPEALAQLKLVIKRFERPLLAWLAGSEADRRPPNASSGRSGHA